MGLEKHPFHVKRHANVAPQSRTFSTHGRNTGIFLEPEYDVNLTDGMMCNQIDYPGKNQGFGLKNPKNQKSGDWKEG